MGKQWKQWLNLFLWAPKITADFDRSHEIKRHLLLGRKAMTNLKSESEVAQSCLTLSDPMDCSLPGSSVHGIFQARVLEWGAIAFSEKHPWQHIKEWTWLYSNKTLFKKQVEGHDWPVGHGLWTLDLSVHVKDLLWLNESFI